MPDLRDELRHGRGLMMRRDRTRLLLAFTSKPDMKALLRVLEKFGLTEEETEVDKDQGRQLEVINKTDQRLWIRSVEGGPIGEDTIKKLREDLEKFKPDWMGPVYAMPNAEGRKGLLCPLPNVVIVKPARRQDDGDRLTKWMAKHKWEEVEEKSKYLSGYRYFVARDPEKMSAYAMRDRLQKQKELVQDARLENMPMIVPSAMIPNDPMWLQQWDMTQINAQDGWDIETGNNSVVVCVLDTGCDLTHPDLVYASNGINLDTMSGDGSPTGDHGTACAGIVAATLDNSEGVAGVAGGGCEILPAAFVYWTESEVAGGINYARTNGALVISMSFGWDPWDPLLIDPAIQDAYNDGLVMCVATHNHNATVTYPATNPLVMACGASDQVDNRKDPASPDGEYWWGSNFGPEMSVVAPGVLIPTTDRQGDDGYNTLAGTAGDYFDMFNGTSSATPHVAGLAALLLSQYPTLTNDDVRNIIERTAERVGVVPYTETPGYPNGPWNDEMGYGRINVHRALNLADLMVRDYPADTGEEPSSPPGGNYWRYSDIVVRITDDNVFVPDDPSKSSNVERGQTNYLYVRVTNNGPREAVDVTVDARITPWVGTQFVYPDDWMLTDVMHVAPTPVTASFASIPVGGSEIAKFEISSGQVEDLWGWVSGNSWHPCLLARVLGDNDYTFQSAMPGTGVVPRHNNLAQRNLSVIDVIGGATATLPFVIGHFRNADNIMELIIDRRELPRQAPLTLSLDEDGSAFPRVDFFRGMLPDPRKAREQDRSFIAPEDCGEGIMFLDRARLAVSICDCTGILTLERGSRFDCMPRTRLEVLKLRGGELSVEGGRRMIRITEDRAVITLQKAAGVMYPTALTTKVPFNAKAGSEFGIHVAQRNSAGNVVGGAGAIFIVQ